NFRLDVKPEGFRESGINVSIADNGTNFGSGAFPAIGYQSSRELIMPADRREFGLTARPVIPSLYDSVARARISGGIEFEAIVSTTNDQVGVAPGKLVRSWKTADRNYFHYAADAPIGSEWAFFSARYSVHEATWKPTISSNAVAIRIFHHPEHTAHLDWMVRSITASLDYYTKEFGPYRYGHLTVVEVPGAGTGIHADPSILTYTEGATRWKSPENEQQLDFPYAVMAHEVAHQWTVPYAFVEGAPVMSESVAWYYAMKAVEHARGRNQLDRLRAFMRQPHPYAPIRRGEPLLRGLDPYMSYRKGPFALYALSEYVGEQSVNKALRTMLENHRPEGAPVATTLDLFAELKRVTPDSLQYLLHDFFEVNTFWELVAKKAVAKRNSESSWQVSIEIDAKKVVADSSGAESDVAMDDWVGIAIYSEDQKTSPIYKQKHRIRSGKQTIIITVKERPGRAAIDPDFLLVDLTPENNSCDIAQ
ncbi:MAG TPA: M1 family aminopeptidase, partial [Chryseosolibacter sp.]